MKRSEVGQMAQRRGRKDSQRIHNRTVTNWGKKEAIKAERVYKSNRIQ